MLSFGAVVYFVYRLHSDNVKPSIVGAAPENVGITSQDYGAILRELEELRRRQDNMPSMSVQTDYVELVDRVMPSMVYIVAGKWSGSGFFVSANGDILTNYHVIKNAESIIVITHNRQIFSALVKDTDPIRDMALLKIYMNNASPALRISHELLRQGQKLIAIGNPQGYLETVSDGIISGFRTFQNNSWVQFTAPVSPGSSGGALVNLNGEVIGMPTKLRTDGQNLNFAIAPDVLSQFLRTAINKPAVALNRPVTQPQSRQTPSSREGLDSPPGTRFIRRDNEYDMYLYTAQIDYDNRTKIASFITLWWPTEKAKEKMRKDSHFIVPAGKDLGICVLLNANFRDNKYVHLRTVNYCTDGKTIARDYVKPSHEIVWRTPKKGSRAEILMNEVRKELRTQ